MIKQIWKFILEPNQSSITMPDGSEILTVQMQDDKPCIWALVNPLNTPTVRYFEVYGTGHSIHYDMGIERKYINTFQPGKGLVFHLFERLN